MSAVARQPAGRRNHPWLMLAAVAVVVAASNLAYDKLLRQPERERAEQVVKEAAQIMQAEQARQQSQAIAQALREERLRQGIFAAAGLRMAVTEYLANEGRLPQALEQLGMPEVAGSPAVESVSLEPGAAIVLRFSPRLDLAGSVTLRPEVNADLGMIGQWHCQSGDFPFIESAVVGCSYTGAPSKADAAAR